MDSGSETYAKVNAKRHEARLKRETKAKSRGRNMKKRTGESSI